MLGRVNEVKAHMLRWKQKGGDMQVPRKEALQHDTQRRGVGNIIDKCAESCLSINETINVTDETVTQTCQVPNGPENERENGTEGAPEKHNVVQTDVGKMWKALPTADELLAAAVRTESALQKEAATAARTTTTALRKIKLDQLADPKNGYAGMMHHLRAPRGNAMAVGKTSWRR